MPSRIPIIFYLAFCLHSALITLKTLIFRPLQRVDKVEIRLHSSLHLSALACTCLHLHNHTVGTCTYEGPALIKMRHGNKIILYRESDNSVGATVFSLALYSFFALSKQFCSFGQTKMWKCIHAFSADKCREECRRISTLSTRLKPMIIRAFNSISAECRHFLHKQP